MTFLDDLAAWFEDQRSAKGICDAIGLRVTETTAHAFRIGYAPDDDSLDAYLAKRDVPARITESLHLSQLRGRLVFPVENEARRVVAFLGRARRSEDDAGNPLPKYVSTPEHDGFVRAETLYGLAQARDAIASRGEVVIVETVVDVLQLHERGAANVVAVMSGRFSADYASALRRYTRRAVLRFDADAAGRKLASEAQIACQAVGIEAR